MSSPRAGVTAVLLALACGTRVLQAVGNVFGAHDCSTAGGGTLTKSNCTMNSDVGIANAGNVINAAACTVP